MAEWIDPPVETDPGELAQESFDEFAERMPGWEPNPAAPETIILEDTAAMAAESRDVASRVPRAIGRFLGASLYGLPPTTAAPAHVDSTWTAQDAAGYTIEEGWAVGVRAAGDELVMFSVAEPVVIAPGQTTTPAGAVRLVAQQDAAAGNGLGGAGVAAELVESTDDQFAVVLTGETEGGADEEDEQAYLNRLAGELRLQSPRPILPPDFAVLARRVQPVGRALAVDLYKPADQPNPGDPEETNRPRSVTVVVAQADGEVVPAGTKEAVRALLDAMREVNFEVWVVDPTYTLVNVRFAGVALPGYEPDDVRQRAEAAVAAYLGPANFGRFAFGDEETWLRETRVRTSELIQVLNGVDGFWRLDQDVAPDGSPEDNALGIALAKDGSGYGVADVPLLGVGPLTRPGPVIVGTVVGAT